MRKWKQPITKLKKPKLNIIKADKLLIFRSRNFRKYEFLTDKDVLSKKDLLDKATTMKEHKYSSVGE